MDIDVRITVKRKAVKRLEMEEVEESLLESLVDVDILGGIMSAVILRNNGFGHMLPDESSRITRP